jgi:UPF0271 protein
MRKSAIDVNCDMGESFGRYTLGHDEGVIRYISSANIACGYHAGDPHVMRRTVALAVERGVGIGAHPGLPDLMGFGRRPVAVTAAELRDYFTYQIGALRAFADAAGAPLRHVKMHGALFEMALTDESLARAMCQATGEAGGDLIWLCPAGTAATHGREAGLRTAEEFYADRAYHPDLRLVSRKRPGSVLKDPELIRRRLLELFESGTVETIEGERIALEFDSICVHGDTPGALEIVRLIREACTVARVAVRPLAELLS